MGSEDLSRIAGSDQGLAVQGLRAMEDGVGTFGVVAESRASADHVATQELGGSSSSYAFTEPKWRWNTRDPKIQLYLRTDDQLTGEGLTADQAQAAITAAANTWEDAVGQKLFAYGTVVIPSGTVSADDPYDEVNVHAWKKLTKAPGALAYSRTRYNTPIVDGYYSVMESDVSYNTDVDWSTSADDGTLRAAGQPFDVQTVALHELGHTIGLGDLYTLPASDPRYSDWSQIMNSYNDVQRTLGSGDTAGVQKMYGMPEVFGPSGTLTLYRMYNPYARDHFYTTSFNEYSTTAVYYGYKQEGALGFISGNNVAGTIPLYRMYSPKARDHFYTTSYNEYSTTAVNYGYLQEGLVGYLYRINDVATALVYRMYSPTAKDHFYTTSFSEYTRTAVNYGYVQEGSIGYVRT